MKAFATATVAILSMVGCTSAHMEMKYPPPFRSKFNSHTTDIDYSMTNPLSREGSDFPCKGYHNLMGTPQGASVANWAPGQTLSMTITGGTPHNGGSCQASLSYDRGSTWKAIHSYYGNCPVMGDSSYTFTLPNDTPAGEALFAWSWFNQIGNREMYMNCAVVTIGARTTDLSVRGPQDPFASRPAMFVANVGNGCSTPEGLDVQFPNPGPDVTNNSGKLGAPVGSCGGRKAPTVKRSTLPREAPNTLLTAARPAPTAAKESESESESVGAFVKGEACDDEGAWNCIDGTEIQRCAAGKWTALQDVYPGTACKEGVSVQSSLIRDKSPPVNYARVLRETREAAARAKTT